MSTLISHHKAGPASTLGRAWAAVSVRTSVIIAIVLAAALVYWLWFGLLAQSINKDDGITILAVQGILDHGYPQLPSGYIYTRGVLPTYMVAGVVFLLGLNDFSIMIPSLVMGLATLWLVYLFSKDILGKPWLGVISVVLLLTLIIQADYATSPRMYMALEFFSTLAAYSAWRGFIRGRILYRWLTLLAVSGALLSHEQAILLLIVIPASIGVVLWLTGGNLKSVLSLPHLASLLVLGTLGVFILEYPFPNAMPSITAWQSSVPTFFGLNYHPIIWGQHIQKLEEIVPYGLTIMPIATVLAFGPFVWKRLESYPGLMYAVLVFVLSMVLVMVGTPRTGGRLFLFVLPLYAMILCASGAALVSSFVNTNHSPRKAIPRQLLIVLLLIGLVTPNLGYLLFAINPNYGGYYLLRPKSAFGFSCDYEIPCFKSVKQHYGDLRQRVKPDDVIISSTPQITSYYLGRVDGFLLQHSSNHLTDEYLGIPLVDTVDELLALRNGEQQVWVIVDPIGKMSPNAEQHIKFLDSEFHQAYSDGYLTTYVNPKYLGQAID